MRNPYQLALDMYKQYGEAYTIRVANQRLTFLVGPSAGEFFFKAKDTELSQKEAYKFSVSIFGKGVVYDVDPAVRTQQIKFMSGSLRADAIRSYVPDMQMEAEAFFEEKWGNGGGSIESLGKHMAELIILTASRCLMGPEIREELFGEVSRLFETIDAGLLPITFFLPNLPISAHRARDAAREEMIGLFSKVLKERRAKANKIYTGVLDVFANATYKDGTALSDQEVCGLMLALLFAGQHTSSNTSTNTLLSILAEKRAKEAAGLPSYFDEIMAEQNELIAEYGTDFSLEVVDKMDKLHAAIKETLRLTPPLILVIRKALVDFQVKTMDPNTPDYTVPAGDWVFVCPPVSGRMPNIYAEPEAWDPARMLPPREEDKAHRFAFAGFGGGRHGCLGENFAYAQVKVILSIVLRKYAMNLVGPDPVQDYTALVVGPHPTRVEYELK